jgi:hypothetical protein
MAYKYRAGGCVAPPISGTSPNATPERAPTAGKMERAGKPTNSHIVSQTEHGLHDRDDPLPPAAVAAGWKK